MGQNQSMPGGDKPDDKTKEKKKWEPPAAPTVRLSHLTLTPMLVGSSVASYIARCRCDSDSALSLSQRVGKKQKKHRGPDVGSRLPAITPNSKCKLRLLKLERVKDYLLMEEEFVSNQERLKPQEQKNEEDRSKVTAPFNRLRLRGFERARSHEAYATARLLVAVWERNVGG
jgi:hypothetical protein